MKKLVPMGLCLLLTSCGVYQAADSFTIMSKKAHNFEQSKLVKGKEIVGNLDEAFENRCVVALANVKKKHAYTNEGQATEVIDISLPGCQR